ncbi:MAG: phosphoribosylformylglycinamidine synthase subunit PurS [Tepidanaerobacteraceae bacterium]|nr:phosphoribosylformylglycinamidine synthase subunit PurS [Thermoanaerobacterales bacterium]
MFLAKVYITYKTGVLDPQSSAIKGSLASSGFENVKDVQTGKFYELKVEAQDKAHAQQVIEGLCERVLVNPVIEDFKIEIMEAKQ